MISFFERRTEKYKAKKLQKLGDAEYVLWLKKYVRQIEKSDKFFLWCSWLIVVSTFCWAVMELVYTIISPTFGMILLTMLLYSISLSWFMFIMMGKFRNVYDKLKKELQELEKPNMGI
ncbi:MAG: hypothetical protein LBG88_01545 [Christensenellaceae bacterium]|nr:hypothetical protein [Christensenellaceae bacterium]